MLTHALIEMAVDPKRHFERGVAEGLFDYQRVDAELGHPGRPGVAQSMRRYPGGVRSAHSSGGAGQRRRRKRSGGRAGPGWCCHSALQIAVLLLSYAVGLLDRTISLVTLWVALRTITDVCSRDGPYG